MGRIKIDPDRNPEAYSLGKQLSIIKFVLKKEREKNDKLSYILNKFHKERIKDKLKIKILKNKIRELERNEFDE